MQNITSGSLLLALTSEPSKGLVVPIQSPPILGVGPAIGLAIGAAATGAILSTVFFLLYYRRKRRSDPPRQSFALGTTITPLYKLPQPIPDSGIKRDLNCLQTQIRDFVDNCFEYGAVTISAKEDADIRALAGHPPHGFSTWSDALNRPKRNGPTIQALIAQALFAAIHPLSDRDMTLLPLEVKVAYRKSLHANARGIIHGHDAKSADAQLLSWWRQISGHFLLKNNGLDPEQMQAAVATFDAVLAQLHPRHERRYLKDLEDVVKETAALGLRLFQQQYEWQAIWEPPLGHDSRSRVVVFPGMIFLSEGQPDICGRGFESENSVKFDIITRA